MLEDSENEADVHCHSQQNLAVIQTVKVEFLTFFSNMKQYIQYSHIMAEVHSSMFFDPEAHPEDTLKAFLEFTQRFILQYNPKFPDPPKVSLELTIKR